MEHHVRARRRRRRRRGRARRGAHHLQAGRHPAAHALLQGAADAGGGGGARRRAQRRRVRDAVRAAHVGGARRGGEPHAQAPRVRARAHAVRLHLRRRRVQRRAAHRGRDDAPGEQAAHHRGLLLRQRPRQAPRGGQRSDGGGAQGELVGDGAERRGRDGGRDHAAEARAGRRGRGDADGGAHSARGDHHRRRGRAAARAGRRRHHAAPAARPAQLVAGVHSDKQRTQVQLRRGPDGPRRAGGGARRGLLARRRRQAAAPRGHLGARAHPTAWAHERARALARPAPPRAEHARWRVLGRRRRIDGIVAQGRAVVQPLAALRGHPVVLADAAVPVRLAVVARPRLRAARELLAQSAHRQRAQRARPHGVQPQVRWPRPHGLQPQVWRPATGRAA
mmetsp:Transcript_5967/g.23593  ORF Transcript_5967/g.23593 Transcript_5967/m.23593 type:complete len:393 (-) Transcript_5967:1742-2920(-)